MNVEIINGCSQDETVVQRLQSPGQNCTCNGQGRQVCMEELKVEAAEIALPAEFISALIWFITWALHTIQQGTEVFDKAIDTSI